jgi:hypothetical protein
MDNITSILLGLTASERWAATRRLSPRSVPQQWLVLLGVAVLLVLLVLLLAISFRRRQQSRGQRTEAFDREALRKGLATRERQVLLAIAARSGLRRAADIFHAAEAFQRGAAQLFAEFAQTHGPPANTELRAEVARLYEKLRFRTARGGQTARRRPGSRDIPAGKSIELIGSREHGAIAIQARMLRNDESELVVALPTQVSSKTGDPWLVRYYSGVTAWEFRTSTVRCDGGRLTLRHSDEIRPIDRRRFPRVPVCAPALIAYLPLLEKGPPIADFCDGDPKEVVVADAVSPGTDAQKVMGARPTGGGGPVFVESTVTEVAGPGLRLETRLQVHVGDRVLVVVHLTQKGNDGQTVRRTLAALGRVKRGQDMEGAAGIPDAIDRLWQESPQREAGALAPRPVSVAVELIGLDDEDIVALASLTHELSSLVPDNDVSRGMKPQETPAYAFDV